MSNLFAPINVPDDAVAYRKAHPLVASLGATARNSSESVALQKYVARHAYWGFDRVARRFVRALRHPGGGGPVPIGPPIAGPPIAGTTFHRLDEEFRPIPARQTGTLWTGGIG